MPDRTGPPALEPMLATAARELPRGGGWAHEIKWDGVRALARVAGGELRLAARRGTDLTERYPELAALGGAVGDHELVLDGEIVAFNSQGRPDFGLLQRRMGLADAGRIRLRMSETPVTYVIFDLLWLDGRSLCELPLSERRARLEELALDGASWQTPGQHRGDPVAFWEAVRERGLEGVVAKRLDGVYRPGRRSSEWVKVQHRRRQELLVGGWMPGEGLRARQVGSLLVGYWDATPEEAERLGRDQRLVYAGGVGTGFTEAALESLAEALEPLARPASPFEAGWDPEVKYAARARERGGLRWVEPEMVCEVEFLAWTHEDTLRAASFKGLRTDKDPRTVVRQPNT